MLMKHHPHPSYGLPKRFIKAADIDGVPTNCVNAAGVYFLMLQGEKPVCEEFREWIIKELFPRELGNKGRDTWRLLLSSPLRKGRQFQAWVCEAVVPKYSQTARHREIFGQDFSDALAGNLHRTSIPIEGA